MQVIKISKELSDWVTLHQSQNKSLGFVPTMGALHDGHLSLIEKAKNNADLVISSIYVNPLQFNNPEDFKNYPSTIEQDLEKLEKAGCDVAFLPDYHQIYDGYTIKEFDMHQLDASMEGFYRPGHFNGMANVVMRFFEIIRPNKAFFGLKDYQQYIIVKTLAAKLFPSLEIIGVETLRDKNGFALSSRNLRLNETELKAASKVNGLIKEEITAIQNGKNLSEAILHLTKKIEDLPTLRVEYITLANALTLTPLKNYETSIPSRIFIAFYAGNIRLIDNFSM